jgi:hypothetical protein
MNYYLGLDISTSCVGICLMTEGMRLVKLNAVTPKVLTKIEDKDIILYEKKRSIEQWIEDNLSDYKITHVFIEAPLQRSNNQNTVITLTKFNTLISNMVYEKGYNIQHITEHVARATFLPEYLVEKTEKGIKKQVLSYPINRDKKELVWEKVDRLIKDSASGFWIYDKKNKLKVESFDMSDAYAVCYAGISLNKLP